MVKVERITIEPITTDEHDATPLPGRVKIDGQPTTLYLESALWKLLRAIADNRRLTLDELCSNIAEATAPHASFAESARAYVIGELCLQDMPDELWPEELRSLKELGYRRSIQ